MHQYNMNSNMCRNYVVTPNFVDKPIQNILFLQNLRKVRSLFPNPFLIMDLMIYQLTTFHATFTITTLLKGAPHSKYVSTNYIIIVQTFCFQRLVTTVRLQSTQLQ